MKGRAMSPPIGSRRNPRNLVFALKGRSDGIVVADGQLPPRCLGQVLGDCGGQLAKQSSALTGAEFFRQRPMSLQNLPDGIQDVRADRQGKGCSARGRLGVSSGAPHRLLRKPWQARSLAESEVPLVPCRPTRGADPRRGLGVGRHGPVMEGADRRKAGNMVSPRDQRSADQQLPRASRVKSESKACVYFFAMIHGSWR